MTGDAWLTIVIGASGVVAIIAVGLVARSIRPDGGSRHPTPSSGGNEWDFGPLPAETRTVSTRAWTFRSFGPWHRQHSVEDNLQRAFARIDAVDPEALPRRIGSALAETGLLSETPRERIAQRPRPTWPFNQLRDTEHGKDEE